MRKNSPVHSMRYVAVTPASIMTAMSTRKAMNRLMRPGTTIVDVPSSASARRRSSAKDACVVISSYAPAKRDDHAIEGRVGAGRAGTEIIDGVAGEARCLLVDERLDVGMVNEVLHDLVHQTIERRARSERGEGRFEAGLQAAAGDFA